MVKSVQTKGSGVADPVIDTYHQANTVLDVDDRVCTEGISHGATAEVACKEMESLLEMPVGVAREQVRREVEVLEEERNRQRRDEAAVESHMYQDVRVSWGGGRQEIS